ILDQSFVDIDIAGLAYNPDSQHLFVMANFYSAIYVLDTAHAYANLGSITIGGFDTAEGAGLEIDCDGSLWAVNQEQNVVYQIDSGETTTMCTHDLTWLNETPSVGTV